MSSPRDRDGFEDPSAWREPEHLGEGGQPADPPADPPAEPGPGDQNRSWQPPGWDLPPAADPAAGAPAEDRSAAPPETTGPWAPRQRRLGEVEKVFRYEGDAFGVQAWAEQHGWTVSDGSAPEDAVLTELVRSAPVRATKDHRAMPVLRGRYGSLELVAFDVVYASGRYAVPEWAVTAVPLLVPPPMLRLSPARFWKHRTGGLLQIPSGDEVFDTRWVLLAAEDGPQVRALAQDAEVHRLLLGSDDGDEFWSAAGHVAAVRPDGHRPQLLEHHARLLSAVVSALTGD
jgi:hypothetical protein